VTCCPSRPSPPPAPTPSPAADGLLGIRLLEAPVERRDDPRARLYVVDHVTPGTTITRRLVHLDVGTGGEQRSDFAIGAVAVTRDAAGVPVLRAEVANTAAAPWTCPARWT
jgi:hypothetical protein